MEKKKYRCPLKKQQQTNKKLTVGRKKAKILTVNRKSHYPIETLKKCFLSQFGLDSI